MNKIKTKVAFVLSTLTGGGAERVTLNLINKLDKKQFEVHLLVLQEYGEYFSQIPDNITLHILHVKRTFFAPPSLRKLLKEIQPNIIYATLFHTSIALFLSVIALKNKPKIILRNPTSPKRIVEENEISFFYRKALQIVYNKVDLLVAQTPEMKEEIHDYFKVSKERILVFINPLDTEKIDRLSRGVANPFDDNKVNIVAAGRLSYEKGFDVLINSFAAVVKDKKDFFLHIIGKDEGELENLNALIKILNLNEYIKLWGFQQNPYKFFKYSNLYVLSSRIEGLPNTVLENLYLGKPVVSTKCIPFMTTLIQDKKNGFIVDVEDVNALSNAISNFNQLEIDKITLSLDFGDPNQLFSLVNT